MNPDIPPSLHRLLCFYGNPADGQGPRYLAGTEGTPGHRNYDHESHLTRIRDIKGCENSFNLYTHSFMALPNVYPKETIPIDFNSGCEVSERFLAVADRILADSLGDTALIVRFDVQVRRASRVKTAARQVNKIHIDQSPSGALRRAQRHLPESIFNDVSNGQVRLRIINLWKPIEGRVKDHPLAFADCRTLTPNDLVPVPQIYPDYIGETLAVRYGAQQEFWYWSDMDVQDVLLLQCFDTHTQKAASGISHGQCAHGTFQLRDDGEEGFERASIELRYLVVSQKPTEM